MNILLLSMPDIHPSFNPRRIAISNLALSSIAANLEKKHEVFIGDLVLKRCNVKKAVLEALKIADPELVGLSAMSFQYDTALRIARFIKKNFPDIKIALGGYHATLMYEEITESKDGDYFDFIFRQEADLSFNELINALDQNKNDFCHILGLSFRSGDKFIHNAPRPLEELHNIKHPVRTGRIWKGYHSLGRHIEAVETSRGCLMNCKFCSIRQMYGKSLRYYEIDRIIEDIENAKRNGARSIFIVDDNITMNPKRFIEICDALINSKNDDLYIGVQVSSKGIASSEELVEKMALAGVKQVFLGIENISDSNLQYLHKGDKTHTSRKAIKLLKKKHIVVIGGIIIGNPEDNKEDIEANYKFLNDNNIDMALDQILTPYLKTEIREELMGKKLISNYDNYKLYNGFYANVNTNYLQSDEISFLKWKNYMKYMNTAGSLKVFKSDYIRFYWPFILRSLSTELTRQLPAIIRNCFKTEREKFQIDMDNNLKNNKFNI